MAFFKGKLGNPATDAAAVTPNDATDLSGVAQALYIGVGGDVQITTAAGNTVVFIGLVSGVILPVRSKRVWVTNTTATSIVALY